MTKLSPGIKKKLRIYLFKFYNIKLLYISFRLLTLRKSKKFEQKPIQFLKTSRYVIPLPSVDADEIKKKKKNIFKFVLLLDFYIALTKIFMVILQVYY
jgi:hypothetical protein